MTAAVKPDPAPPPLTLSGREQREYRLARTISELASDRISRRGIAFEIDEQLRKDWELPDPRSERAVIMPYESLDAPLTRAGLYTGSGTAGGDLVFTEGRPWLDMLRIQSVALHCGATFLTGLKGPLAVPQVTAAETITSMAENSGSNVADSQVTFGQVAIPPYELQSATQYSRQLLAQSRVVPGNAVDLIVARSMARQHGVQVDILALGGLGSGSNQPTGVATQLSGAQLIAFGTNGAQPTWTNLVNIEQAVANANAAYPEFDAEGDDTGLPTSCFVISPTMRNRLRITDRGGSTTTGRFLLESDRLFNTYPVMVTNGVPQALTKGSASTCQAMIFGVWENLYIGFWGPGLELVVDPFTYKKQGMVEVASYQLFGAAVVQVGAFAGSLDALP